MVLVFTKASVVGASGIFSEETCQLSTLLKSKTKRATSTQKGVRFKHQTGIHSIGIHVGALAWSLRKGASAPRVVACREEAYIQTECFQDLNGMRLS